MQKQDEPYQPVPEDLHDPPWTPPPPPEPGKREWFMMILERFGFWIACALTIAVIAYLYINADRVPRQTQVPSSVVGEEQGTPSHNQGVGTEALSVLAVEPDTAAANVLLVTTDPAGAAIFIDGNYVGASPLRNSALTEGRHLISVLKPDYTQLDTFITLTEASTLLQLTLREAGAVILAEENENAPPETPTATDETDRNETLSPPATPALEQTGQEQTTPPRNADETRPAENLPNDEPLPVAETDEAFVVEADEAPGVPVEEAPAAAAEEQSTGQVGELQVNSEPSGASVLVAGQEIGVTPVLLTDVQVGPQPITLRLDGYEDFATTVNIVAAQQSTVNGQLKQRLGTLRILVKPWGNIYIDGELKKEESTIWYVAELPPGIHRVRVEHPSLGNWEQVIEVSASEERSVTIDYNKSDSDGQ